MDMAISSQADAGKSCSKCGVHRPLTEFRFYPAKKRHRSQCRDCERETIKGYNRRYYKQNRERVIEVNTAYRVQNSDRYREWQRVYQAKTHREYKLAALEVIGMQCACCGEATIEFLSIDHIDNDGRIHRKEIGRNGSIYDWLAKVGYKTRYRLQTLCFNCNFAKRYNGICPHQSEGSTTIPFVEVRRKRGGSAGPLHSEGDDIV